MIPYPLCHQDTESITLTLEIRGAGLLGPLSRSLFGGLRMAEATPSTAEWLHRLTPQLLCISASPLLPPWSPFCAPCLTCLLSPPAAQTQTTVVPGESCCLLTPGYSLPLSNPQGPQPVAPGGDCGDAPPLRTCPGHSRACRRFQMSHNTGILWPGSVISGLPGYTVSSKSFG